MLDPDPVGQVLPGAGVTGQSVTVGAQHLVGHPQTRLGGDAGDLDLISMRAAGLTASATVPYGQYEGK